MSTSLRTEGQEIVSKEFARQATEANITFDGADWHETSEGFKHSFQLFVVSANGKTFKTRFNDDNLEDSPATPAIRFALAQEVKSLVGRIQAGDDSDRYRRPGTR
jgi:hypothetical protein